MALLQRGVDAHVGRFERAGRVHDGLALVVEAVRHAGHLVQQVLRHVLEQVGLARTGPRWHAAIGA